MSDYREVRTTQHEEGRTQRAATFKATQLIWLFLGILEVLVGLRIFFKMIGVNAGNPFAAFLYAVTDLFIAPFASLIGTPVAGNMVFEISSVIAMIVYLLFAYGLERIVYAVFYRPRGPVSVRQTIVSDHVPQQAPLGVSQTIRTDRSTTQSPVGATHQTSVTESVQPPQSL